MFSTQKQGRLTIHFEHTLEILLCKIEQRLDLRDTGIRYHGV
jgi:hypothetical protein